MDVLQAAGMDMDAHAAASVIMAAALAGSEEIVMRNDFVVANKKNGIREEVRSGGHRSMLPHVLLTFGRAFSHVAASRFR